MDSALAVLSDGQTIVNVNDVELREYECGQIRQDIGDAQVVLNQFSIAGYNGMQPVEDHISHAAARVLTNMTNNHRDLGAQVTIPFASYMYFSKKDNSYLNSFANRPSDAMAAFTKEGLDLLPLPAGDTYELGQELDTVAGLKHYEALYDCFGAVSIDESPVVELKNIQAAFIKLADHLRDSYPHSVLDLVKTIRVRVPDLDVVVDLSLSGESLDIATQPDLYDVEICSQPLWFLLSFPFGSQTLGVSGRAKVFSNYRRWRLLRAILALNNAEIYLKPRLLVSRQNIGYFRARRSGLARQLVRRYLG